MEGEKVFILLFSVLPLIELSFRLALVRAYTHEPTFSRTLAPVDSETAIVVDGSNGKRGFQIEAYILYLQIAIIAFPVHGRRCFLSLL